MTKNCDNQCTGILIFKGGKLLLIERKKYNPGFACPAGHNDGDSPEDTALKETKEEVGLEISSLKKVFEGRIENPCKRGQAFHNWAIFEANSWSGEIIPEDDEVKSFVWAEKDFLNELAKRLEQFMESNNLSLENMEELVRATNESDNWWQNPGLEPPWYVILKKLEII